jgi:hypothetical protein
MPRTQEAGQRRRFWPRTDPAGGGDRFGRASGQIPAPDLGGSDGQHHPPSYDILILILKAISILTETDTVDALRSGNMLGLGSVHG